MNDAMSAASARPDAAASYAARPAFPRAPVRDAPPPDTISMRVLLAAFRRRLWAFLAVLFIVPAGAWVAIQRSAPLYTATGALLYEPSEYKARELQSILRSDPITDAVLASQAEVLRSLKIAQRVAERGRLYDNPEFNPALRPPSRLTAFIRDMTRIPGLDATAPERDAPGAGPAPNANRDSTVLAVHDALRAAPVRFSHVLEVTFTAQNPLVAAAAVNNAMDVYVKDQFSAKAGAVRRANAWLEERARGLRAEVRAAEDKIAAYRSDNNFSQGMYAGLDAEKITRLNEDLIRVRAELAAADARLDQARGRAGAAAQARIAPSVVTARAHLEGVLAKTQGSGGRFGANHPEAESGRREVEEARRAVNAEIANVVAATEQDRRAVAERVTALEANLQDARRGADVSAKARIPLNALERDTEASRAQLQSVLERIQQTAQQHAIETSEAHEISLAMPPREPSWPRTGPVMMAALGAGALLGLLTVYALHLTDGALNSGEDVRALTGLPCFALIPELDRRTLRHTAIEDFTARRPLTVFSEQIRAVRAALWVGESKPRVVAITAARPAEGKSVLALSLARSASLSGEKVLLIDCDMRRPSLARRLRADNRIGLSGLLRGQATLEDVLHGEAVGRRTDAAGGERRGGMHFIPAGPPAGDAFGLFMGGDMARLLAEARRRYTLIVLDTPPVQAITEARVLAGIADAAVLCVRWRSTPRDAVTNALELLEDAHAQVTGVVLTRVDPRAHVRSGYADAEVYHPRYNAYHSG